MDKSNYGLKIICHKQTTVVSIFGPTSFRRRLFQHQLGYFVPVLFDADLLSANLVLFDSSVIHSFFFVSLCLWSVYSTHSLAKEASTQSYHEIVFILYAKSL